ncbi:hypothetical protein TRVL_03737 [Trypanosoma vivax]|nr:hypothetical protein TRVL_03737 [Trypanosoma vivax]
MASSPLHGEVLRTRKTEPPAPSPSPTGASSTLLTWDIIFWEGSTAAPTAALASGASNSATQLYLIYVCIYLLLGLSCPVLYKHLQYDREVRLVVQSACLKRNTEKTCGVALSRDACERQRGHGVSHKIAPYKK